MKSNWRRREGVETKADGSVLASVLVPSDSPWFSGHFPGDPVLPAIAQLEMTLDAARKAFGRELIPKAISRTKYRKIIRPDDVVNIVLSPIEDETMTLRFQLTVNGELACKGLMKMASTK